MKLQLSVEQVKEAVAAYVNDQAFLVDICVKPEHITVTSHTEGDYDDSTTVFDGLEIDLAAAKDEFLRKPTS
jgi:hypothetical protein